MSVQTPKVYSLAQTARKVGVASITLKRWLLAGKIREVARDRNGWRMFTDGDIAQIKLYAKKMTPPKA